MASEDVQTNLRLPADLKDRLVAAANENNRSLSAEAAYRLEESFSEKGSHIVVFEQIMEKHIGELKSRIEMLDLRRDMIRTRVDSARVRSRLVEREIELARLRPEHQENDVLLRAAGVEMDAVEDELKTLAKDLRQLDQVRQALLDDIEQTKAAIADGRGELERRVNVRKSKP
ncbi:Arc family DNA-binding protein [Simplicispira psychrophila]|uniref:Arc family DNA-binding protein n=1 Tax=Simplicispira psychrophila TaxID=80882 RepID=UPI000A031A34|nr:Arc family DNA-binding protein [Simplicispira psychrophila]